MSSEPPVVDERAAALVRAHSYLIIPSARFELFDRVNVGGDGEVWQRGPLRVIWSIAYELDARPWLHVSASRATRLPDYTDMVRVHRAFVGLDRYAYEVRAPSSRHVNIHPYALHMWAVADGGPEPMPDFTRGTGSI